MSRSTITAAEFQQLLNRPAEVEPEPTPAEPWEPPVGVTRAEYWREYHAWRQANDPEYRARKAAAATRAKARRRMARGEPAPGSGSTTTKGGPHG